LRKLKSLIGAETFLLEGGSIINGAFQEAEAIDELSLVVAPLVADSKDKPLFAKSNMSAFKLIKAEIKDGVVVLNYKK